MTALHGGSNQLRVDEHEHLLHGRVIVCYEYDDDDKAGETHETSPLSRVQLTLMHGDTVIGATRTYADGSYTMLFTTASVIAATHHRRKRQDVWLRVFNAEIDPCKAVNITKRSSLTAELLDATQADRVVHDGLIWEQSLEIDFRDAVPECVGAAPVSQTLLTRFQDLQADEFRAVIQDLAGEVIGELPLSLAEIAALLCYGVFAVLLCVLMWISRLRATSLKEPSPPRLNVITTFSSYDQTMSKFGRFDRETLRTCHGGFDERGTRRATFLVRRYSPTSVRE